MANPEGKLTPVQHEILEMAWAAGDRGTTVSELWEAIAAKRSVTRTTVLNLVDRLHKRGWFERRKTDGAYRYFVTVDRATTSQMVAREFVDEFFDGSPSKLLMSLLGGKRLKPADVDRLRRLLDSAPEEDQRERRK